MHVFKDTHTYIYMVSYMKYLHITLKNMEIWVMSTHTIVHWEKLVHSS